MFGMEQEVVLVPISRPESSVGVVTSQVPEPLRPGRLQQVEVWFEDLSRAPHPWPQIVTGFLL